MSPLGALLLLVWPLAAASDVAAESWQSQLTPQQQHELQDRLKALEQEERIQLGYASEYGDQAIKEQKEEFQTQKTDIIAKFKGKAAAAAAQSGKGAPQDTGSAVFLLADPKADNATGKDAHASADEAWRERLTPKQRQELDHRLSELHKKAAREESLARRDSQRQFREMHEEYVRKESHLLQDFKRMADPRSKVQEEQHHEHHGLRHQLTELRKKAAREEALARRDGPKELKERRQEYARKEERLLSKIAQQQNASSASPEAADKPTAKNASAQPDEHGHVGAGDSAALTMLAEGKAPAPHAEAGAASHAGSSEGWRGRLTAKQRQELDHRLSELRKKAAKEKALASKDGDRELNETREEYARKGSHLLRDFEGMVTQRAREGSEKSHVSGPDHELAELRKKAAREEAYAREDGPQELQERRQEFARAEERLLAKLRKEQNASEAAPSIVLFAAAANASNASSSSESSEREWRQRLSEKQRREMQHRLEDLFRETRVQMGYASEYGPAAVRYQEAEFERRVAKVMAHYKAVAESRSHGEPAAGFLIATLAGHGPLGLLALAAAAGVPAALVALAVGRRRAAAAASLQAPLMSEP